MAGKRHRGWRRKGALIIAALAGGWLAGSLLRPEPAEPAMTELRRPARAAERLDETALPALAERAEMPAAQVADGMVSFSRLQWSRLVRDPSALRIPLSEYLPLTNPEEAIPVINDVPLIGRLFQTRIVSGLKEAADLFGWDDALTRQVAGILTKYGRAMAEAEKGAETTVEYLPEGGLRFDFAESQPQREAAAAELRQALVGLLGARDADRFASVSDLDGLAGPLPTIYTINASARNGFVSIQSDSGELIMPDDSASHLPSLNAVMIPHSAVAQRVRHLGLEIDWGRVLADAEAAGRAGK